MISTIAPVKIAIQKPLGIHPMRFSASLLFFGIPSAIAWFCIYIIYPALSKMGLPQLWILWMCIGTPLFLMLVAALIAYRLEGNPWTWRGIKSRFRIKPMSRGDWLWTLVLIAWIGGYMLLHGSLSKWLAAIPFFAPPNFLPSLLDPRVTSTSIPSEFLGIPLKGNWWILFIQTGVLFFNIFGEEFWWRGYILPRQELTHGKHTWWIHGLLWTAFHTFWKWDFLSLMPGCLLLSYVVFRQKNTTPAIIWHWLNNSITLVVIFLGIVGFGS